MIACAKLTPDERVAAANAISDKLMQAKGPTTFIMPLGGIDEWDKEGGPFRDEAGLAAFADTIREKIKPPVNLVELDAHINDDAFADAALTILDAWIADGTISVEA